MTSRGRKGAYRNVLGFSFRLLAYSGSFVMKPSPRKQWLQTAALNFGSPFNGINRCVLSDGYPVELRDTCNPPESSSRRAISQCSNVPTTTCCNEAFLFLFFNDAGVGAREKETSLLGKKKVRKD